MTDIRTRQKNRRERGASLLEFAMAALVFFLALFAVLEVGRLLWIHNTITAAVRQGARYASLHSPNEMQVKAVVVYGTAAPAASARPVAAGLTPDMVQVAYSTPFGVKLGAVTVTISGYAFDFTVPGLGRAITLPAYKSTMMAESAGIAP